MEKESYLIEVMKLYQQKLRIVNEIYNQTEEIGKLLSLNDMVSAELMLSMRQEEMNQADRCSASMNILIEAMELGERQRLFQILESQMGSHLAETFEEKKILEISQQIQSILKKSVELDKRISVRVAGKDSYYSKMGESKSL